MVKTGRWSNVFVAGHLHTLQPSIGDAQPHSVVPHATQHVPNRTCGMVGTDTELGEFHCAVDSHITGLPKVSQELPLRGSTQQPSLGPLYDQNTVLGGLVDTWRVVDKLPGHRMLGASDCTSDRLSLCAASRFGSSHRVAGWPEAS